ncbi:MAG TPA: hypothetical protein VH413_09810 [Verrucomicrobiae bacterium]|jgi:hypothetical protein|nr:hypothetical protein [Verrucomicrobiae bacterium]
MKNIFTLFLFSILFCAAGCASKPDSNPAGAAQQADWQYRTFPISAKTFSDVQYQMHNLQMQGWTYVAVDSSSATTAGGLYLVRMKRPNR